MASPDTASEMACPMVLQGVVGDKQLLLLLPLTPFTYHVVLARTLGAKARNRAITNVVNNLLLMTFLLSSRRLVLNVWEWHFHPEHLNAFRDVLSSFLLLLLERLIARTTVS